MEKPRQRDLIARARIRAELMIDRYPGGRITSGMPGSAFAAYFSGCRFASRWVSRSAAVDLSAPSPSRTTEIPGARAIEIRVIALDQAFSLFGRESDDCIVQMKRSGYLAPTELLVRNASLPRKHLPEQAVAEIAVHICSALWLRETPALDEFE